MRRAVASITTTFHRGGAEMRTLEVVSALSSADLPIHVVAVASPGAAHPLEPDFRRAGAQTHFHPLRSLKGWAGAWRLFRRMRVVHSQAGMVAGPVLALAWLAGVEVRVAHFHSDRPELPAGRGGRVLRRVGGWFVRTFATDIWGVSEQALETVLGSSWHEDPRCSVVVPGVDLSRFASVDPSGSSAVRTDGLGLDPGARVVLHVGIDTPGKNRERAVRVLASSSDKDLHLVFVGAVDPDSQERCRGIGEDLGVSERLHWTGERSDVPELLVAASALLVTSTYEGVPGVVLEAVAAGTPVVSSNLPSILRISDAVGAFIDPLPLDEPDEVWGAALDRAVATTPACAEPWNRLRGTAYDAETAIDRFAALWRAERGGQAPVVVHMFSSLAYGGAEMRTLELIRHLSPRDYRIVMLQTSPTPGPLTGDFEEADAQVITVRFKSLAFLRTVRRLFVRGDVSAVHVHVMLGHERSNVLLGLAALWRVPQRVLHYRNEGRMARGPAGRAVEKVFHAVGLASATTVGGVSPGALEAVLGPAWSQDRRAALMLPGLAVDRFYEPADNGKLRSLIGCPDGARVILVLGRDDPQKNREWAVEVFAALMASGGPDYRLVFVGKTDRSVTDMVGERTFLAPYVHVLPARSDVPDLLAGADVMLLPSRHEGLPGVVMESLAAGTPVVATALPGTEFIEETFGELVTLVSLEEDAGVWASAVAGVLGEGDRSTGDRRAALERVASSRFAMSHVARVYERAWGVARTGAVRRG